MAPTAPRSSKTTRTRSSRQVRAGAPLNDAFVTAEELTPRAHLEMQAALQRHIDSSISKTINCPPDIGFEAFKDVYLEAYDLGLKGCTTYRPNMVSWRRAEPDGGSARHPRASWPWLLAPTLLTNRLRRR